MLNLNFHPFPTLNTNRLTLRQLRAEDAEDMFALRTDETLLKHVDIVVPKTLDDAAAFIQKILVLQNTGEGLMWGIAIKDDDRLIGTICFWHIVPENYRTEIGYMLLSAYHGRGFMQEAITTVIAYGFTVMNLHSIEAQVGSENAASLRLLERNHFVREGYFKENYCKDGIFLDTAVYSLINGGE